MRSVWMVASGAYSSWSVDAIFDNEGAANAYADVLGRTGMEGAEVIEHVLYSTAQRVRVWNAAGNLDGWRRGNGYDVLAEDYQPSVRTAPWRPDGRGDDFAEVIADDRDRAEKILHDTLAQLAAQREGIA